MLFPKLNLPNPYSLRNLSLEPSSLNCISKNLPLGRKWIPRKEDGGELQYIDAYIWNYFPWGSLFQYIYCFPKGGASTPIRNHPKGMYELYLFDCVYLYIDIVNNKCIRNPFMKIMLKFGLQQCQPLLKIHTFVPSGYNPSHGNSIFPFIEDHEHI